MKNFKSNLKGFTLVELIVVMAIIGVLAAVLVPGLLGYMKDSRISSANQNAHAVYTAISSWHAKEVAANDNAASFAASGVGLTTKSGGNTKAAPTAPVTFTVVGGVTVPNMRDKLGENFYGTGYVQFTSAGDAVQFACWNADTTGAITVAGTGTNNQYKTVDQDGFTTTASIIGCSPLAS